MELEVGMYVRTKNGMIAKIIGKVLEPDNYYFQCWVTDRYLCICDDTEYLCDSDVIKANYNIIDLIEVGDYVNGYKTFEKDDYLWIERLDNHETPHFTRIDYLDIKSIVTKEQFESMQYRVGE